MSVDRQVMGQRRQATVFWGQWKQSDGGKTIEFDEKPSSVDVSLNRGWFADQPKFHAVDFDGDGCGGIVLTEFDKRIGRDELKIQLLRNQYREARELEFERIEMLVREPTRPGQAVV